MRNRRRVVIQWKRRIRNVRVIKALREELAKDLSYVSRGGSRETIITQLIVSGMGEVPLRDLQ